MVGGTLRKLPIAVVRPTIIDGLAERRGRMPGSVDNGFQRALSSGRYVMGRIIGPSPNERELLLETLHGVLQRDLAQARITEEFRRRGSGRGESPLSKTAIEPVDREEFLDADALRRAVYSRASAPIPAFPPRGKERPPAGQPPAAEQ